MTDRMTFTSNIEETQVNRVAQHASKSSRTSGPPASLEACSYLGGGSALGSRWGLLAGAVRGSITLLAVALVVACSAGVAQAEDVHLPLFQLGEIPAEGPHGEPIAHPGRLEEMESATIDSGHLWVAEDTNVLGASRIDEFNAETGAFIAQPVHSEASTNNERSPTGYGQGYGEGIAVGHGPGEAVVYAGAQVHGVSVVSIFNEAGVQKGTWDGHSTPAGTFGFIVEHPEEYLVGTVGDVAVDNSTSTLDPGKGNVFVVDPYQGIIDIFHPDAEGEERYVGQITGISPSQDFGPDLEQVAVDEANGDLLVINGVEKNSKRLGMVDVFEPTALGGYEFVRTLAGPPPSGIFGSLASVAVDSSDGEIYVSEFEPTNGDKTERINEFNAAGTYVGHIAGAPQVKALAVDPKTHYIDAANQFYGPDVVIPDVATAAASNVKPESVTLNGTVNPDEAGNATCEFEWGTTTAFGNTTPCSEAVPNGEGQVSVHASLAGLERDETYYFRLRAANANGTNAGEAWQDQQFSTYGLVVRAGFVSDVTAGAATFGATVDPGERPASVYFQYGTSSEYGQQTHAPPGEAIGSGTADVQVPSRTIQGLSPATLYHYRVVVVSEIAPGEFETVDGPDGTFTTQAAQGSFTPVDNRQWQLVSPAQKFGALIQGIGTREQKLVQASAAGDAIAYRASSPTESEPQAGYAANETVLSTRGPAGWSSQDISPPRVHAANASATLGDEFQIFSEDLSRAAVQPIERSFNPLSPEAIESTAYLRSDYLNGDVAEHCEASYKSAASCFTPLVSRVNDTASPFQPFGEEPTGVCTKYLCGARFMGGSPDLQHVVLASSSQLTATPLPVANLSGTSFPNGQGLYEWSQGSLQLLDVLPPGEEGAATIAGAGVPEMGVRHSISDNGERVLMEGILPVGGSERDTAGLYLRDVPANETIRLDVPQGGSGPSEDASFMDANGEASRIFFLDSGRLMADSSPSGADLYEYNLNAPAGSRLTDLTVDPHAGKSANVAMMLGASEDDSYIYFAAAGALAPGAVEGECPRALNGSQGGGCNVYVRHEGVTQLVAVLPANEAYDWSLTLNRDRGGPGLYARVSPNGRWLAFMSAGELTGYDTRDARSGQPDLEVYLYHAPAAAGEAGAMICASCNPTGARPVGEPGKELLGQDGAVFTERWVAASVAPWSGSGEANYLAESLAVYQPRYLSDAGRLFFDSVDSLVPQDVDGSEDVYEYEPEGVPAGEHACSSASTSGNVVFKPARSFVVEGRAGEESAGCVGLISSGTSSEPSWFLDASETGGDVFFITQARLAQQDGDTAYDVYDAHECTSASPCLPVTVSPPPCDTEASCKAAPEPQPALFGLPSSATFSGPGNITPPASPAPPVKAAVKKPAKCTKDEVRNKRHKCVKMKKKQPKAKKSVHSDRRASR
jgi:hypothetical protein